MSHYHQKGYHYDKEKDQNVSEIIAFVNLIISVIPRKGYNHCQFDQLRGLKGKSEENQPPLRAMSYVTQEKNQKEQQKGYGMDGIGMSDNNTIIDAESRYHKYETRHYPIDLFDIERLSSAAGKVKSCTVEIQQPYAAYHHNDDQKYPIKIDKQSAIDLHNYVPSRPEIADTDPTPFADLHTSPAS